MPALQTIGLFTGGVYVALGAFAAVFSAGRTS